MRVFTSVSLAVVLWCSTLQASEKRSIYDLLDDTLVAKTIQVALGNIAQAKCLDALCDPASAAEKANPPISIASARTAMNMGMLSGSAEVCGLDWKQRVYLPFMTDLDETQNLSDRQLALMAVLMSLMRNRIKETFKKQNKPCSDQLRLETEKAIAAANLPKTRAK
jgi:hypothetical protein